MPPRHGKSETISRRVPAWFLDLWPDKRVMLASYNAPFARTWSRKVRNDLIQAGRESLVRVRVSPTSRRANEWETTAGGGMIASGVGGEFTGRGADLLIIDDPVKNAEEANSETVRENQWDWYQTTAATRLEPGGITVIVMTRWNEDDLVGRLVKGAKNGGAPVFVLTLPATCEDEDDPTERILGRKNGGALWPERFSEVDLVVIKRARGSYVWAALYQQRPMPAGGLLFKKEHFRYWDRSQTGYYVLRHGEDEGGDETIATEKCRKFGTVDLATSLKETADYTVCFAWAVTPKKDLLLLGGVRARMEGPDHLPLVRDTLDRYSLSFVGIEKVQYQMSLIQQAKRKGLPAKELPADRDKLTRAIPAAARIESHNVFFPLVWDLADDFEGELASFPNGAHDDMVDVLSYAVRIVVDGTFLITAGPRTTEPRPSYWRSGAGAGPLKRR
jgi:predicted phage terminase large subunit-like protein